MKEPEILPQVATGSAYGTPAVSSESLNITNMQISARYLAFNVESCNAGAEAVISVPVTGENYNDYNIAVTVSAFYNLSKISVTPITFAPGAGGSYSPEESEITISNSIGSSVTITGISLVNGHDFVLTNTASAIGRGIPSNGTAISIGAKVKPEPGLTNSSDDYVAVDYEYTRSGSSQIFQACQATVISFTATPTPPSGGGSTGGGSTGGGSTGGSTGGSGGGGGGGGAASTPVVVAPTTGSDSVAAAVEKGTTPQITAGTNGTASVPASDVKTLAEAKKPVEVTNGTNEVKLPAEVFTKNPTAEVTVGVTQADANTIAKAGEALAKDEKATQIGGAENTVSIAVKAGTTDVKSFYHPVKLQTKVSAETLKGVKDVNHLTMAKVNDDGSLTYIGGKYDAATGTFAANTETIGNFILVEKEDIKKITLGIGETDVDVNGADIANDVAPLIVENRTMMPLRFIAETLGADVKWDQKTKTVTVDVNGQKLTMQIGQEIPGYGVGPMLKGNRTMVPIRYIAEQLGANVLWNPDNKEVEIVK